MQPDLSHSPAERALQLARSKGVVRQYIGRTRLRRLRRAPKAILVTAANEANGVTLTDRTPARFPARIDHHASIDVLRLRKPMEAANAA